MLYDSLLIGEKIKLAPISTADLSSVARWHQSVEYLRLASDGPAVPQSEESLKDWFLPKNDRQIMFGIRVLEDNALVGFVQLEIESWVHRGCELSIGIGEVNRRGCGYGSEAILMSTNFAFYELNLHRVHLGVYSYNTKAIALYEKLGFKHEGVFREYLRRDGKWFDLIWMSILSHEWESHEFAQRTKKTMGTSRP